MPSMIHFLSSPEQNPPRYFRVLIKNFPECWLKIYRCAVENYDMGTIILDTMEERNVLTTFQIREVQEVFPIDWSDPKNIKFFQKEGYIIGKNDWIEEKIAPRRYRRLCVQYAEFCRNEWHIVAINESLNDFIPYKKTENFTVIQKVLDLTQ